MEEILRIANEKRLSVFLAIRKDGLSSYEEVKDSMLKKYPDIGIHGIEIDCHSDRSDSEAEESAVYRKRFLDYARNDTAMRDIVFCNFGAPYQELFLSDLKNNRGNIRLAMGVGGAFDFLTGKVPRAPKCLRTIGLEWLWRLLLQPIRWKRIWNVVLIFPLKVCQNIKKSP